MEGIRNADVVVGPVRAFRDHDVGSHARQVGLIRERDQVEHQLHLLGEVVQFSHGSLGNLERGQIFRRRLLRRAARSRERFRDIRRERPCRRSRGRPCRLLGAVQDQIEQAVRACADGRALLRRVAFTEQLQKDLPRIRSPSAAAIPRRGTTAWYSMPPLPAADCTVVSDGDFERGQRRVLADDFRDHLIESRGHVRAGTRRYPDGWR